MLSARSALLAALLCHGVIGGPAVRPSQQHVLTGDHPQIESPQQATRKLQGRFLHITDLHPDEFYRVHSSTAENDACHRGSGPAGTYGAETSDCDTPWTLINATFDYIEKHFKDQIDFVVWTGDSARHDSDEKIPRSQSQVLGSNRAVAHKFAETFADKTGHQLAVPVVATLGNNDILPHNILLPGPNKWLRYYTEIWAPFIPEEQRHSFEFGGWYYVEVIPNKLAVFSLNTLYFFDRNAAVDDCVNPAEPGFKQMEWLRVQLQFMRRRGMKAMLMGHVPPARTDSKQLWDESCWQKYTLWLKQFRDVVVGGLYGHMNIDHFMLQDTKDINYDVLGGATEQGMFVRDAMEDELSVASTADYLQELRENWAKLPKPQSVTEKEEEEEEEESAGVEGQGGKKHRKKKGKGGKKGRKGGRWGERYQLTLVGPSIVPNYLPTLRVYEYNISGLEDVPVWADVQRSAPAPVPAAEPEDEAGMVIELRDVPEVEYQKKGHKKKGKGKKPKKPKDPNLVVPEPPSAHTPPGPAYSAQPLTLTGFTQYYANLTHINNDMTAGGADDDVDGSRWRRGKHGDKDPKRKPAEPREFAYEVEYSTFDDALYNLTDLTVGSYAELAWRMGRDARVGKDAQGLEGEVEDEDDDEDEDGAVFGSEDSEGVAEETEEEDDEDEVEADGKKHKKKGKKHGRKKHNKVWLHFLSHAFVKTVERKDLKKLDH